MKKVEVPNAEKEVVIKLTMKELLILLGDKFTYDKGSLARARKNVRKQIENK